VTPSCTFSRITSIASLAGARGTEGSEYGLTSHSQTREGSRPVLRHLELQNDLLPGMWWAECEEDVEKGIRQPREVRDGQLSVG
jgi:hypothetical protein